MTQRSKRPHSHENEQYFNVKHLVNPRVEDPASHTLWICASGIQGSPWSCLRAIPFI